jgi:hypothetical protein
VKRGFNRRIWLALTLIIAGVLLIGAAAGVYAWKGNSDDIATNWQVTLTGSGGVQKILSYAEIRKMSSYTGRGGFFTTTGVVNGPYNARGVPIEDLCALVGGLTSGNIVKISAVDGYSTMLSFPQVKAILSPTIPPV